MTNITFRELVNLLPRGDELRGEAAKTLPAGVSWVEESNPCFVEPDLEVQQSIESGITSVVLLSAPGAVGKSTVAAEIASSARAFLWDLSKFQVGSRTFAGTILELYGFVSAGVQKRLREGNFLFVLDALDEAEVRAGSQNFEAFIKDLAETLREPRTKPSIVVLARSDTADWVHLLLADAEVPLARYQIRYFDKSRAISFIEKRLDDRRRREGAALLHRQQVQPFSEALSELFNLIYGLFGVSEQDAWDDNRVMNFLGYAPVLEALTDYLDINNYMALIQELRDEAGAAHDPWQFLTDIINRLSLREQTKVQGAVRGQLESAAKGAQWSDWQRLYTPSEQCSRVLGWALRVPVDPLGSSLPNVLARGYEEALQTILPQHPFLSGREFANVVFKEFVYAWGIVNGSAPLTEGLRKALRDHEDPFLPSQLFSRFIVNVGDEGTVVVDGRDFGILYESFLSRPQGVEMTLLQAGEEIHASIILDGGKEGETEVEVLDAGSGVHFWRRLCCADIDIRGNVRLGLAGQRFLLGPSAEVVCGQFSVECQDLEVDASENVRIRAGSYIPGLPNQNIRVRNELDGTFEVQWPGLGHPWVLYRASQGDAPLQLSDTVRGDTLRKFVMTFRRQRTRQTRTVWKDRWSPNQFTDRDELLDLAVRRGVLREISGRDHLELSPDYDSLRTLLDDRPSLSPNARQFVADYLGSEQATRLLG